MMNETPFHKFIKLISFDRQINATQKIINQLNQDVQVLLQQDQALQDELEKVRSNLHATKKEVDSTELDMKAFDQREREKKKRLDMVANQKEYKSLKKEIDALYVEQHELEESLIKIWNAYETVAKEHKSKKTDIAEKRAVLKVSIAEKKEKSASLEQELAEKEKIRQEKKAGVPEEWLEKYSAMRSQVSDPVVQVVQGICNACFHQVTQQDLQLLRRNKLLQCKGCYRFLYLESLKQSAETSA